MVCGIDPVAFKVLPKLLKCHANARQNVKTLVGVSLPIFILLVGKIIDLAPEPDFAVKLILNTGIQVDDRIHIQKLVVERQISRKAGLVTDESGALSDQEGINCKAKRAFSLKPQTGCQIKVGAVQCFF